MYVCSYGVERVKNEISKLDHMLSVYDSLSLPQVFWTSLVLRTLTITALSSSVSTLPMNSCSSTSTTRFSPWRRQVGKTLYTHMYITILLRGVAGGKVAASCIESIYHISLISSRP